jgi:hypothetical protein
VTTDGKHPAPFTESIIDRLEVLIPKHIPPDRVIHDPFGGEGVRLGKLCDKLGYTFSGTDLENWRGGDERVIEGDATYAWSYPLVPYAVVTSPTYNNGCNDHFEAKDDSRRLTYRDRAGHALHDNNTGRWSGRSSKKAEAQYWKLTRKSVVHWPNIAIVNVKDSVRSTWDGGIYPLVQLWTELLEEFGYQVDAEEVKCPGWRFGQNSDKRLQTESILVATHPFRPSL